MVEIEKMEILNSGSFITLDNRDKIEQLIFTAKELARAAIAAEGFVGSPSANQSLALQMWQGAEYVCREHEEPTIKNIFLSNFLQQLRGLVQTLQISSPVEPIANHDRDVTLASSTAVAPVSDEYLRIVEPNERDPGETVRHGSYAEECIPPGEAAIATFDQDETPSGEIEEAEPIANLTEELGEPPKPSNTEDDPGKPSKSTENGSSPSQVQSIVLAEKEPYNFDSCTVTAVVQLLPVQSETRKCVISVRTHDFTPQIIISELKAPEFTDGLLKALEASYSQYRNDLPARSAEKLKQQKTANKKRATKTTEPAKQQQARSDAKANVSGSTKAANEPVASAAIPATDQASLFRW